MSDERKNVVTFKGNPMTLVGPALEVGDPAPDFEAIDQELKPVTLASSRGKVRFFSAVPSLDTPVCSLQTKHLSRDLEAMPESVQFYTVSADLPFAQKRWCGAEGVKAVTLSDHRKLSFAERYGILIAELRLLTRAIFIVDAEERIAYVEIVPEITKEPDYARAIAALEKVKGMA